VTRDEVLAWLDGHVGDDISVSTDITSGDVPKELLSTSGTLAKSPTYSGVYGVGDTTLDTRELNDAQLEAATPGVHVDFPHDSLRIPLAGDVSLLLDYQIWDPG